MADNVALNPGVGGATVSTDEIAGVHVQRVKVQFGVDGSAVDVSAANPLPITIISGAPSVAQFAEDAVHGSGDQGIQLLAVRRDSASSGVSADGDYAALSVDSVGALRVGSPQLPAALVSGALNVRLGASAALVQVIGPDDRDVPVSTQPQLMGARASTAAPTAVSADNDTVDLWASRRGALYTSMRDDDGDSAMDNTNNSLRVSIVSGAGSGGTSMTDDAAFTVGVTGITPAGGYYLAARDTVNDGDAGALAMTQRRALYATLETPDGDSVMDETNNAVQVNVVASSLTLGTSMVDDAGFTVGTTRVTPAAGIYRTSRDLVDDGDAGALAMTQRRGLLVVVEDSSGNALGTTGAPFPVRMYDGSGDSCMDNANDALRVSVVSGSAGGALHTDDAAFTAGTSTFAPVGGLYLGSRDTVNDSDAGAFAMTQKRAIYSALETPAGDSAMDETNDSVRVSVVAGSLGGTFGESTTDSITAVDDAVMFTNGEFYGSIGIDVSGTWVATLQFEYSINLSDWFALPVYPVGGGGPVTSTTANGRWQTQLAGLCRVRVRASAYTSGTAVGKIVAKVASWVPPTEGPAAVDAPWSGNPVIMGGRASGSAPGGVSSNDDVQMLWMLGTGAACVQVTAAGALIGGDATNGLDVDVTRMAPGTGATDLGKAEDAVHGSGDVGVMALAVRRDAASAGAADGDYCALSVDSTGALRVAGGGGGTQFAEDAAHVSGDVGTLALAVRRDSASSGTSADGDYASLNVNSSGSLRVHIESGATSVAQFSEDAAHASGDQGIQLLAVRRDTAASSSGTDGDYSTLNVNSVGRLWASATIDAALPAGTNNIGDVDVLTLPGVAGTAAHDAAVAGNPVLVGFEARTSDGTAVANNDVVRAMADKLGKQIVHIGATPEQRGNGKGTFTNTTAADILAAPGANIRWVVTNIVVVNGHATVATKVEIRDGATVIMQEYAGAVGGGWSMSNPEGIFHGSGNTAITARNVTTGADVDVFISGYKEPT